jgi:uncharacterized protein
MSSLTTKESGTSAAWTFVRAIASGFLIAAAGIIPWTVLALLNAKFRPDLPWAAVATAVYLTLLLAWLDGGGWPRSTREARRHHLKLWRPVSGAWRGNNLLILLVLMAATIALYPAWIAFTPRRVPDLSGYPTTEIRVSLLFMGALVSGVVEEVAFRGYMQSQLERFGPTVAIVVTSLAFVLAHATSGLAALPLAGGLFVAGVLYGLLAQRSGSILPGMTIHSAGDAAFTYFGLLNGDPKLLFVS